MIEHRRPGYWTWVAFGYVILIAAWALSLVVVTLGCVVMAVVRLVQGDYDQSGALSLMGIILMFTATVAVRADMRLMDWTERRLRL